MLRTLVIDRKEMILDSTGKRLIIRADCGRTQNIPLNGLAQVLIVNNITIKSHTINLLSEHGIPLVIMNSRNPKKLSLVYGPHHKYSERRLEQYRLVTDQRQKFILSKQLILGKTRGQLRTLNLLKKKRALHRFVLTDGIKKLHGLIVKIESVPENININIIRGLEGACSAIYFKAFTAVFAPALGFTRRIKRPATDPVNALLSLTYTLLYSECSNALYSSGLDPMLGVLHEPSYGRASLACDMSELYRARLDYWIYEIFRDQILRKEHFSNSDDGKSCLLMKAGRKIYYSRWQAKAMFLRRVLRKQGYQWAKEFIMNKPHQSDWLALK